MKRLIIALLFISSSVYAHGGEDHGVAATNAGPAVSGSQLRIVTYPGNLEVFAKYPAKKLSEPVTGRLFFAEYASNHPVNPTGIELSFPGTLGAKVTKQPTKISDGVYEFTAVFIRDTGHTALLRYTYGDAEQLASLSPFYAGASAVRMITTTGEPVSPTDGPSFPIWLLILLASGLVVLGYALFQRRRKRLQVISVKGSATTIKETKITQ